MQKGLMRVDKKGNTEMEFFNHLTIDHDNKVVLYSFVDNRDEKAIRRFEESLRVTEDYKGYAVFMLPKTTLEIKGEKPKND